MVFHYFKLIKFINLKIVNYREIINEENVEVIVVQSWLGRRANDR